MPPLYISGADCLSVDLAKKNNRMAISARFLLETSSGWYIKSNLKNGSAPIPRFAKGIWNMVKPQSKNLQVKINYINGLDISYPNMSGSWHFPTKMKRRFPPKPWHRRWDEVPLDSRRARRPAGKCQGTPGNFSSGGCDNANKKMKNHAIARNQLFRFLGFWRCSRQAVEVGSSHQVWPTASMVLFSTVLRVNLPKHCR